MEQVPKAVNLLARRGRVANYIQASLQPAQHLLEEGKLADFDEEVGAEAQGFEVREYQLDAWGALWDARQDGAKSGLIHLATGLGKTSVGVFDVIKFREEHKDRHGHEPYILVACNQIEILEQSAERFAAFIPDASQGFYNGEEKVRDADITFATLQSLHATLGQFEPDEFDYIIYDEAHHSKAETFEQVVSYFKPEFQLALTATPDRFDELNIRELFGKELYSKGLPQALAEGLLATPDYHIVFDEALKMAIEAGFDIGTLKELNQLFEVRSRNKVIAKNIKEEMQRIGLKFGGDKTIVFCQDIAHAEQMAKILGGKAYHSGITNKKERKDILNAFKYGDLNVICTRDMFNEGVDIPDARLIVFLRSTASQTVFEQQLGRGLRKHAGKDRVTVLDFVANVERISLIRELAKIVRDYAQHESSGPGESESLNIHTPYGDFEFDRIAVSILDKYNELWSLKDRSQFNELTNDELINLALQLQADKPLSQRKIKKLSKDGIFVSNDEIRRRFGSLTNFSLACGFEVIYTKSMDENSIIELALDISPDTPLSTSQISELSKEGKFVSPPTIVERFGSFAAFQEACGFKRLRHKSTKIIKANEMSEDDIVALANTLSPNAPLNINGINNLSREGNFVSLSTVQKRFGSLGAFQKACGFVVKEKIDSNKLSNEDLLDLAKKLSPDQPLKQKDVARYSKEGKFVSTSVLTKRFGSLEAFQKACGFSTRRGPKPKLNE